ncbi:Kinase, NEK [Giardia muris]|uniref:non-specific serine/threonine protein kinase n=1 Tax=Giardia muris TaxID=5742 RepID=A0A4Z1T9D2_GIAMU|nr:Kinase, NEK [Giardia muris]|eukprot:TNJ29757.1 Kinase, NEK [Giardia muris]
MDEYEGIVQDGYEIECLIGQGSVGRVFRARDLEQDKLYAYKIVPYEHGEMRKRLEEKIYLTRQLSHPNIIKIHKVFHSAEAMEFHIIMDLCEGGDMRALIDSYVRQNKRFSEGTVWLYLAQTLSALAYLHCPFKPGIKSCGRIIHRDIKPANIFITQGSTLILGDFDICKNLGRHSLADAMIGTPCYMAPEILLEMDNKYTEKADIWGLGLILYELLSLKRLVTGNTVEETCNTIRSLSFPVIIESASIDMNEVLNGMLDIDPTTRLSAFELLMHPKILMYVERLYGKQFIHGLTEVILPHTTDVGTNSLLSSLPSVTRGGESDLQVLLDKQINKTPLMVAAEQGNSTAITSHLSKYLGRKDIRGYTALMYAAENGHVDCVRILAEHESGAHNMDGYTALLLAVQQKRTNIARFLLAEAQETLPNGCTALMLAASQGCLDLVKLLVRYECKQTLTDGTTALMLAANSGNTTCVKALAKYELRMQNASGYTALMIAVLKGNYDAVKILMKEAGCRMPDGTTALIHAIEKGYGAIVTLLLKKEKELSRANGDSPYTIALRLGRTDFAELISPSAIIHTARPVDGDANRANFTYV